MYQYPRSHVRKATSQRYLLFLTLYRKVKAPGGDHIRNTIGGGNLCSLRKNKSPQGGCHVGNTTGVAIFTIC